MLDEKEGVLLTELDLDYEEQVREELPLLKSRRKDMYRLEKLCKYCYALCEAICACYNFFIN